MTYSQFIREAIQISGMSLTQIAQKLREQGISADKSYISKLQNSSLPPANDRFNDALAAVLDISSTKLKAAAYQEKIPSDVLDELLEELSKK